MTPEPTPLWTLEVLGERVAQALAVGYAGPANGQVRAVPDARTIRYYTTLGLIDRPAEMRGRTALYSRRHLEQIVAVKRLQAAGRALAEIQAELAGLAPAALSRIAAVPDQALAPAGEAEVPDAPAPLERRRERSFWDAATAPVAPAEAADRTAAPPVGVLAGVPLGAGLTLLLSPRRALADSDLVSIRRSAAGLVEALIRSGLISPSGETDPDGAEGDPFDGPPGTTALPAESTSKGAARGPRAKEGQDR